MAKCDVCGKSTAYGRNIRHKHSGRWERKAPRTNRTFKANVQNKTLHFRGVPLRLKICTRCLRTYLKKVSVLQRSAANGRRRHGAPLSQTERLA